MKTEIKGVDGDRLLPSQECKYSVSRVLPLPLRYCHGGSSGLPAAPCRARHCPHGDRALDQGRPEPLVQESGTRGRRGQSCHRMVMVAHSGPAN